MPTVPAFVAFVADVGFTATALATANFSGAMLRDRSVRAEWVYLDGRLRRHLWLVSASFFEAMSLPERGALSAVAMSAGLYVGTGIINVICGYLTHKPLHSASR